ncbi:hypothetical protein C8239_03480 [Paracidovorax avenae]|uniref:hypothetical protein n=1 Tax=Paracidovorax avenae TaxID=80867 RepID=UPI000D158CB6|nr:hypothetical protein [Paracidovorax avenae]AVS83936.1 hypothetical protein C8239_03480 [Paracidovorax avenae]AVS87349.1 hypothetical protein C8238_03015 [Paracidovorax avenae]AVS95085.1 hypothetical protein C8232_01520 [Paracidovorax avenae]AVT01541.1 hypothetical protein C8243_02845 [Paracidovorax avenae]
MKAGLGLPAQQAQGIYTITLEVRANQLAIVNSLLVGTQPEHAAEGAGGMDEGTDVIISEAIDEAQSEGACVRIFSS